MKEISDDKAYNLRESIASKRTNKKEWEEFDV
jgi:hypothetical protein